MNLEQAKLRSLQMKIDRTSQQQFGCEKFLFVIRRNERGLVCQLKIIFPSTMLLILCELDRFN